jgi:integrase
VATLAKYFNLTTGKINNRLPMAPEWNACIGQVYQDMEEAARNIQGRGGIPNAHAMGLEYAEILALREDSKKVKPILISQATGLVGRLHEELAQLELAVVEKKAEIKQAELKLGIYKGALFTDFIRKYMDEKSTLVDGKTLKLYINLQNLVGEFRPAMRIDEITLEVLNDFRDWLILRGLRNLTIRSIFIKFRAVVNHFADLLNLETKGLTKFVNVKRLKNKNLIYLTKPELAELLALPLSNPRHQRVRDTFGLMCLTGLRWSDIFFSKANVKNKVLTLITNKTATEVKIPLSPQAVEILERNNYALKRVAVSEFNTQIKKVCALLPSLNELEQVTHYTGTSKQVEEMPKYDLISAHAGRKTFINLCLQNGVNPATIRGWVGHSDLKMIMEHYAHLSSNQAQEIAKVFA